MLFKDTQLMMEGIDDLYFHFKFKTKVKTIGWNTVWLNQIITLSKN